MIEAVQTPTFQYSLKIISNKQKIKDLPSIEGIQSFSVNTKQSGKYFLYQFVLDFKEKQDLAKLKDQMSAYYEENFPLISLSEENFYTQYKRLAIFDGDMTLWQCEVIDDLGKFVGKEKEVSEITIKAMEGKINFEEALRKRVQLLKGVRLSDLDELLEKIPLTKGIEECFSALKAQGIATAIVSGGFDFVVKPIAEKLGATYCFANKLEVKNRELTGNIIGDIVDADYKEKVLFEIAKKENFPLKSTIAVGDGANDLKMLRAAGLGLGFCGKPIVKEQTFSEINFVDLGLLPLLLGIGE